MLMGETVADGDRKVVAPLTFLRGVLCLSRSHKLRRAAGSCRPRATRTTPTRRKQGPDFVPPGPDNVTIGVLSRLTARWTAPSGPTPSLAPSDLPDRVRHPVHAGPHRRRLLASSRPTTGRSRSGSPTTTRASKPSRSTCCATTTRSRASPPAALQRLRVRATHRGRQGEARAGRFPAHPRGPLPRVEGVAVGDRASRDRRDHRRPSSTATAPRAPSATSPR